MLHVAGAAKEEEIAGALITHLLDTDEWTPPALRAAVCAAGRLKNPQLVLGLLRKGGLLPWFSGHEESLREALELESVDGGGQKPAAKGNRTKNLGDRKTRRRRRAASRPGQNDEATVVLKLPMREGSSAWCSSLARTAIVALAECGRRQEVQQLLHQIEGENKGVLPEGTLRAAFSAIGMIGDEALLTSLLRDVGDAHTGYMTARDWDTLFGVVSKHRGPKEALRYAFEMHAQGGPKPAAVTFTTILASADAKDLDDLDLIEDVLEGVRQSDRTAQPYIMNVYLSALLRKGSHQAILHALQRMADEKWPLILPHIWQVLDKRGTIEKCLPAIERIRARAPSAYTEDFEVEHAMEILVPRGLKGSRASVQNRRGLRNVRREVEMSNRRLQFREAAEQFGLESNSDPLLMTEPEASEPPPTGDDSPRLRQVTE
eukprot:scaffold1199_cov265-Pinguiococcus_pyrenoidosus.AAC.19